MNQGQNLDPKPVLAGKRLVLAITGSIAAYKGADIASKLVQEGAGVDVVMTEAATRFIAPLTLETITGNRVYTGLWQLPHGINHITLAEKADAVVIAPATAGTIARLASGQADDLLGCLVLATRSPVILAPAMHEAMYTNTLTGQNIAKLRENGFSIVEPEKGRLASGGYGKGRLADTAIIIGTTKWLIGKQGDLAGRKIIITSGGTCEPIDPVRFIGNRSSGKTGYELAIAARDRGAAVTLITASDLSGETVGIYAIRAPTAACMQEAVEKAARGADSLIMAAAVADFAPGQPEGQKIKKGSGKFTLELVSTTDILRNTKGDLVRIGFAAETQNIEENARAKLLDKGLDLVVANDVSKPECGFGSNCNRVTLIYRTGQVERLPLLSKKAIAHIILDRLSGLRS